MSALAKPLIHSVNTINAPSEPVNAEHIMHVGKTTTPPNAGTKERYRIDFTILATDNQPKHVTWDFASEQLRDDEFDAVIVATSAAVSAAASS